MSAMINTVRASARRFVDDGWLPLVLFTAVMLAAFFERSARGGPDVRCSAGF